MSTADPRIEAAAKALCEPRHRDPYGWPLVGVTTYCGKCFTQAEAALAAADAVAEPTTDAREALLGEHVDLTDRAAEDGCSCGMDDPSRFERHVADAILAAGWTPPGERVTDPRDVAHIECDCVPDLGPSHCHLCGKRQGSPAPWTTAHPTRTETEVKAEAWDEGERHESEHLAAFGQFCPMEDCNPYREEGA